MRTLRFAAATLIFTLCSSTRVTGQDLTPPSDEPDSAPAHRVSVGLGGGVGSYGFAGQLSVGVATHAGEFIARGAGTEELTIFTGPAESISDFAVLYGRSAKGSSGWLRAAVGPSYVESVQRGDAKSCDWLFCDYEEERSSTVGLGMQVDGVWAIVRSFGLGVSVFADVNEKVPFLGATLGVYLGRLR